MSVSIMYRQKMDFSSCAWMVGFPKFGHILYFSELLLMEVFTAKEIQS